MGNTELFWSDDFQRADSTQIGGGWTSESPGLDVVSGTVKAASQVFAGDTRLAILKSVSANPHIRIGANYAIEAIFTLINDNSSGATRGGILCRVQDAGTANACYLARLDVGQSGTANEDVFTLSIIKVKAGIETILETVTLSSSEINGTSAAADGWKGEAQRLGVRVYDTDTSVVIQVRINNEEQPRLEAEDANYPVYRSAGEFGFEWYEREDLIALGSIEIAAIGDAGDPQEFVVANYYTFGRLRSMARTRGLRDSKSAANDAYWGELVNSAEAELHLVVPKPSWAQKIVTFKTRAGQEEYELSPQVDTFSDTVLDVADGVGITLESEEEFKRKWANNATSGRPILFRIGGAGPNGGPLLRAYPVPDQSLTYTLQVWRTPKYMTEENDIPLTPQRYCQALIWGAINQYAARDSDRTHIAKASAEWMRWLRLIRSNEQRKTQFATRTRLIPGYWPLGVPNYGLRQ